MASCQGIATAYLSPNAECAAQINEYDGEPQSERFGRPWMYTLQINADGKRTNVPGSLSTHHSRIIHVVENPLEDDVFGRPRLRNVFNLLDDLLKVVGGSGESIGLTHDVACMPIFILMPNPWHLESKRSFGTRSTSM